MKLSSSPISIPSPLLLLLLAPSASATFDCKNIVADNVKFNLGELKGAHTVLTTEFTPPSFHNTTFTVDICAPLKRVKDVKKEEKCPLGTWICALEHTTSGETKLLERVIPIADLGKIDPKPLRLSKSDSHDDKKKEKEGLRLTMQGGSYDGHKQKAIIEFLCDQGLTGTEGEMSPPEGEEYEDQPKDGRKIRREEEADDGEKVTDGPQQISKEGAALIFNSYETEGDKEDVLRLTWKTKFACETQETAPPASGHWGFFTWFVIIVFFGTAAYLIFGSWINYSRYGARGWDLLPHGDMIRDIPYLLKDWVRRLINTLQGSGSRGGYSAV